MLMSKALPGVLLWSALAMHNGVVSAVQTMYSSPETDGLSTWQDAKDFCEAKSSTLVTRTELCDYFKTSETLSGDNWGAALDVPDELLQIGSTEEDYCTAYDKDKECPEGRSGTTEAPTLAPTEAALEGLCHLPPDCTTPSCAYQCDLPTGYYPDANDCRSYCFCTGTNAPSRYETVTGPDMIFDPWGRAYWTALYGKGPPSWTPLDPNNVPLGGMNGGTPSSAQNLNKNSQRGYCNYKYQSNTWRTKNGRRLAEPLTASTAITNSSRKLESEMDLCAVQPNYIVCDRTPSGSSNGDPHFSTFGGYKFDFHGGCDLVLLDNPNFHKGMGMRIHVRTKIDTWWSYIEAAAIQIGKHTLEVRGGKESIKYWLDGEEHELETGEIHFGEFRANFRRVKPWQSLIRIHLGHREKDAVSFETYNDFVRAQVKSPTQKDWLGSSGMLGSYPEGKMVARDGSHILSDANEFGQEWQVLSSEPILFHEASDTVQHPARCLMPEENEPAQKPRRRLGESAVTKQDAERACSHVEKAERDGCIFDVMATNDLDMAESY